MQNGYLAGIRFFKVSGFGRQMKLSISARVSERCESLFHGCNMGLVSRHHCRKEFAA